MRDSTMHPDLAAQMRRYDQRIEALEMAQRGVRTPVHVLTVPTEQALAPASTWGSQGAQAFATDLPDWTAVIVGDFFATGYELQGKCYNWVAGADVMDFRVVVQHLGTAGPTEVVFEQLGITGVGDGNGWFATIPDSAVVGTDIRGARMRLGIQIKRVSGVNRVGTAISSVPFNSPE